LQALANISNEILRYHREQSIDDVLQKIAKIIRKALGADVVILYQYNQKTNKFIIGDNGPTIDGEVNHDEHMGHDVYREDVPFQILKNKRPLFVNKADDEIAYTKKNKQRNRFTVREEIKSFAALPLSFEKSKDEEEYVGLLFVNSDLGTYDFNNKTKKYEI
jgi:transcriptional regulator with GAF, ATPase, and Fis domain